MQYNMTTSKQCTHQDMWTSLVEVFRVKTSALPEKAKELGGGNPAYGVKCLEYYGALDQNTQSLKIAQLSCFEDLKECYSIFPKSGMMQNGKLFQTSRLDIQRSGKECTLLPTPTKSDYKATFANKEPLDRYLKSGHQIRIMDILCQKGFEKCQRVQLLEMVMGFKIGHTELAE